MQRLPSLHPFGRGTCASLLAVPEQRQHALRETEFLPCQFAISHGQQMAAVSAPSILKLGEVRTSAPAHLPAERPSAPMCWTRNYLRNTSKE